MALFEGSSPFFRRKNKSLGSAESQQNQGFYYVVIFSKSTKITVKSNIFQHHATQNATRKYTYSSLLFFSAFMPCIYPNKNP